MDFSFSEEQQFLEQMARKVGADLFGEDVAREAMAGDRAAADRGWAAVVEMGWAGLLVPEHLGGSGAGLVEAAIVAEALAHALAPVPFVGTSIAAVTLLRHAGGPVADGLLREIAEGRMVGVAVDDRLSWPPARATIGWDAWVDGSAVVVADDGPQVIDGLVATNGADLLHPLARLPQEVAASTPADAAVALAAMRIGAAAALVGTLRGAADLAFDYVRERKQYGQPIGSFQAVQHLCADVMVDLDSCRSTLFGAAWTVEHGPADEAVQAATVAKSWCADAALRSVETTVQLLGGIGVTWESAAHLYLRQAHAYAGVLGDRRRLHRELGRKLIERQERVDGPA